MTTRPSGSPAPISAALEDGTTLDLLGLAGEIADRHLAEFPDEVERYGDAGRAWCVHDNQHILNWAVGAANGWIELEKELGWLADVLSSRGYPLERLARDLEIAAEVVPSGAVADELRGGAAFVRSRFPC